jgi:hypothetical protein
MLRAHRHCRRDEKFGIVWGGYKNIPQYVELTDYGENQPETAGGTARTRAPQAQRLAVAAC